MAEEKLLVLSVLLHLFSSFHGQQLGDDGKYFVHQSFSTTHFTIIAQQAPIRRWIATFHTS